MMFPPLQKSIRRLTLAAAGLLFAGLSLTACAPLKPETREFPVGHVRLTLPPGQWQDLGITDISLPLASEDGARVSVPSRVVALRGPRQELWAVVQVQAFRNPEAPGRMLWTHACLPQMGVQVEDGAAGSSVRIDCLRFKRWANNAQWLETNQPLFAKTLVQHQLSLPQAASHLSYRYATEGGTFVEVQALVDQRLLRPVTRGNEAFLQATRPGKDWTQQLAQSVRTSVGMWDGHLQIPPFPLTIQP